jgi:two-component system, sensor histidine kinase YesM
MILKFLKSMSIQYKLLISYCLLSIIIISILGISAYRLLETSINQEISKSNLKTLLQISAKIESLTTHIINMSNLINLDSTISNALKTNDLFEKTKYEAILKDQFINYRLVNNFTGYGVTIYGVNQKTYQLFADYTPSRNAHTLNELKSEKWYPAMLEKQGMILWINNFKDFQSGKDDKYLISSVRLFKNIYTGEPIGVISLTFDENSIRTLYQEKSANDSMSCILDENDRVISSNGPKNLFIDKTSHFRKTIEHITETTGQNSGYFNDLVNGEKTLVFFSVMGNTKWTLVQLIKLDTLMKRMNLLKYNILIVSIVCLILSLLFSIVINLQVFLPLKKLQNEMKKIQSGIFEISALETDRDDEIGQLNKGFVMMASELRKMIQNLVEEQSMKRKAELESLQAQINPHFLYNTLNTIRCMLDLDKAKSADSMIISLVKLLKKTLGKDNELITIEEEIETLKHYIYIQEQRYKNFVVTFDVDSSLLNYKIIKLTLQPLVENAIFHGFKSKKEGHIWIMVSKTENDILIRIKDDGVGIPEETQRNLLKTKIHHKFEPFSGIGIKSVHERIVLHFKEHYGLKISSIEGEGTVIDILIPIIKSSGEENINENINR